MNEFILPDRGITTSFIMNGGFNDCVKLKRFKLNKFDLSTVNPSYERALMSFRNCSSLEECDFGELINIKGVEISAITLFSTPIPLLFDILFYICSR